MAGFFDRPFGRPSRQLTPADQALVLNMAGFALRAIGRLPDAVEPMHAAAETSAEQENWKDAAAGFGNLSELLVTLGRLESRGAGSQRATHDGETAGYQSAPHAGALETAAQAVHFADKITPADLFRQITARASQHAAALLARGRLAEAEERFREAERLQQQHQPTLPRLYSMQGFLYGDLLLARRRPQEAADRAEYRLKVVMQGSRNLLDIGLAELQRAQAQSRLISLSPPLPISPSPHLHSTALTALQRANQEAYIVAGYLARTEASLEWLSRCGGFQPPSDDTAAGSHRFGSPELQAEIEPDLLEAETLARRSPMPLFHAEVHLLRARLAIVVFRSAKERPLPQGPKANEEPSAAGERSEDAAFAERKATIHRDAAAELIARHHYGRREPDLAVLDAEITPGADTFAAACERVSEGWWHLLDRLEQLAQDHADQIPDATEMLAPLLEAEKEYHAERDAYLQEQQAATASSAAGGADNPLGELMTEVVLDGLPDEVLQQIADQAGQPANWRQWPAELQQHVVRLVVQSRESSD